MRGSGDAVGAVEGTTPGDADGLGKLSGPGDADGEGSADGVGSADGAGNGGGVGGAVCASVAYGVLATASETIVAHSAARRRVIAASTCDGARRCASGPNQPQLKKCFSSGSNECDATASRKNSSSGLRRGNGTVRCEHGFEKEPW